MLCFNIILNMYTVCVYGQNTVSPSKCKIVELHKKLYNVLEVKTLFNLTLPTCTCILEVLKFQTIYSSKCGLFTVHIIVRMLREELQLLQEQGSYVGEVVKPMDKKKVLVKVSIFK